MEKSNAPMQDFIKLETTLYSLTTKCMKICRGFLKNQFKRGLDEQFESDYWNSNKFDDDLNVCLNKCAQDYAALHHFVRVKFIQDLDNVYNHNQTIYQQFYE